jgi:hypothetical protein
MNPNITIMKMTRLEKISYNKRESYRNKDCR